MPYKSEQIPIAGTRLDKRRKLLPSATEAVKILSEQGYSQRILAKMFGCSKRTIQNILHPQKRVSPKKYPTEYWTQKKREYRQRKQKLFLDGKLNFKRKADE